MLHQIGNIVRKTTVNSLGCGDKSAQWQSEHGMNGNTACIDGGNSRGCYNDVFFLGFTDETVQKSRFSGTCLSGKKNTAAGMFYQLKKRLIHFVKILKITTGLS